MTGQDLRLEGYRLQSEGRFAEAIAAYEAVVARDPEDWEIWNNLGNARRDVGDMAGALDALTIARDLRPDLAAIHYNLGVSLAAAGQLEEGARALGEAARLAPDHPGGLIALGSALRQLGRHAEALAPLARAALLAPAAVEVRLEQGRALSGLGRFDEADRAYRDALALQPGLAMAFHERGLLLERGNRLDRLPALLDEAKAAGVAAGDLSYLRALAFEREGRLDAALVEAKAAVDPVRRAALIGRLADRQGDAAAAFEAYREMNALAGPGWAERAAAYRDHVAALRDLMSGDYGAAWQKVAPDQSRPAPVFLIGFPRSGTTLLDTLLMGHGAIHVLEEAPILQRVGDALGDFSRLPGMGADEVDDLRALYFAELDALDPAAQGRLVVDKLPLNLLGAPLIHRLFPEAKLIFAERHPCDVVLSCFMQNFDLNDAMANFLDLDDAARLYDLALGFWTRARAILPLDVHNLRYEALVAGKEAQMRALIAFLGLAWDAGALDNEASAVRRGPIATPSYHQVVQPIYSRAAGRWERYREQMAGVLPILAPWAGLMGYRT